MHQSRGPRRISWITYILVVVGLYIMYIIMSANPRPPAGIDLRAGPPILDIDAMGGVAAVLPVDTANRDTGLGIEEEKAEVPNALSADEKSALQDMLPNMNRVVHLDLKGAAPKVSYFADIFPLFKTLGATGLLIEWEDTFPYDGNLESISAEDCYSKEDVKEILSLAKKNGLFVIPLIQTFGHMEFVLKGEKFKHLREVPNQPQVINPHKAESLQIIREIIDQQMKLQPNVEHFHIGCDEVWGLGDSPESKEQISRYGMTKDTLFLNHVREVAGYVKNNYPYIETMMWDDMFRTVKIADIMKSKVNTLVTPIVWKYTRELGKVFPPDMWNKYGKLFHSVWLGSAFKGATGSDQYITDISHHYDNHMSWLKVLSSISSGTTNVAGTIITGWQRYDHFATLCELLPVGIPSLAVCLSTLQHAGLPKTQLNNINSILGCSPHSPIQWHIDTKAKPPPMCSYPGHRLLEGVYALKNAQFYVNFFESKNSISGWHKDFHMKHNFAQTFRMKYLLEKCTKAQGYIAEASSIMEEQLARYFSEDTVHEWIETYIDPLQNQIAEKKSQVDKALLVDTWPRRPLHNKPTD